MSVATIDIEDTDDRVELPVSECIAYDSHRFHKDLTDIAIIREPERLSPTEPPPFHVIDEIVSAIPETKVQFFYRDPYQKITHISYKHKSSLWVIPIKPASPKLFPKSRIKDVFRLILQRLGIHVRDVKYG